jgi:hypothetical protein
VFYSCALVDPTQVPGWPGPSGHPVSRARSSGPWSAAQILQNFLKWSYSPPLGITRSFHSSPSSSTWLPLPPAHAGAGARAHPGSRGSSSMIGARSGGREGAHRRGGSGPRKGGATTRGFDAKLLNWKKGCGGIAGRSESFFSFFLSKHIFADGDPVDCWRW